MRPYLVAAAVMALVLYSLAPYISKQLVPAASQQTASAASTATIGNATTGVITQQSSTTIATATSAASNTEQTSTTATIGTTTVEQTSRPRPDIVVELATAIVNATRLPTNATLTFVVINKGDAEGLVYVNNTRIFLKPNEEARLNLTIIVARAGVNQVLLYINGTPKLYQFEALYFTPLLVAEPVVVRTYELPAEIAVNVVIRNLGNYTGYVGGVEIPPGGNATLAVVLNITAAGQYEVDAYGVPVEVYVQYLATGYSVRAYSPEAEIVPGEAVPVAFYLKNTENATETLVVNGTALRLAPGEGVWLNYTVSAYGKRSVALIINGTTWRWALNVSVVALKVLLEIGGGVYNPALTRQIVIESNTSAVPYTWLISTNATGRTVVVVVGGAAYAVPPGGVVRVNGTLQAKLNDWNAVSAQINGTTYSVQVYVQLEPPTLYVAGITGMSFTDSREYTQQASCSGTPIGTITFTAMVYSMSGVVSYSGGTITFSGSISVYIDKLGQTVTASYNGSSTNGVGQVTAWVGLHVIVVKFSGGVVTSVVVDGQEVSCAASIIPIPAFMYQKPPAGTIDAVTFAERIADLFAKGAGEYITNAYYDGQRVVLIDGEGHSMIYAGNSINGPLQVVIYGQISRVS